MSLALHPSERSSHTHTPKNRFRRERAQGFIVMMTSWTQPSQKREEKHAFPCTTQEAASGGSRINDILALVSRLLACRVMLRGSAVAKTPRQAPRTGLEESVARKNGKLPPSSRSLLTDSRVKTRTTTLRRRRREVTTTPQLPPRQQICG